MPGNETRRTAAFDRRGGADPGVDRLFAGCVFGWLLAQLALVAVGETVGNLFSLVDLGPGIFTLRELGLSLASGLASGGFCGAASRVGSDSGEPPGKCQANRVESFVSRKKVLGDPTRSLLSGRFSAYHFSAAASSRTRATVQCRCYWNVGLLAWPCVSLPPYHQLWRQMVLAMGVATARFILG